MNWNLIIFLLILLWLDSGIRLSFPLSFITCEFPYFHLTHIYFKNGKDCTGRCWLCTIWNPRCYSNIFKINLRTLWNAGLYDCEQVNQFNASQSIYSIILQRQIYKQTSLLLMVFLSLHLLLSLHLDSCYQITYSKEFLYPRLNLYHKTVG